MAKTYAEKLKDPRWQRRRLEILSRDEFTCQNCFGSEETLHVHHALYRKGRDPWEYDDDELITLCETCHGNVEASREEILKSLIHPFHGEALLMAHEAITKGGMWHMIHMISCAYCPETNKIRSQSGNETLADSLDDMAEQLKVRGEVLRKGLLTKTSDS